MNSFAEQDEAMLGFHALPVPAVEPEDIADAIAFLNGANAPASLKETLHPSDAVSLQVGEPAQRAASLLSIRQGALYFRFGIGCGSRRQCSIHCLN